MWDLRERFPVSSVTSTAEGMHESEATCLAISNTGHLVATGGLDNTLKVWQEFKGTMQLIQTIPAHSGVVHGLAFSQDDNQLISVGADGGIFVWNIFASDFASEQLAEPSLEQKESSPITN